MAPNVTENQFHTKAAELYEQSVQSLSGQIVEVGYRLQSRDRYFVIFPAFL